MKKILVILAAILSVCTAGAVDIEMVDLGALQLNTDYILKDFKGYQGTFRAPRGGVLNCSFTNSDELDVFTDAAHTKRCKITYNGQYGLHSYDLTVEQGQTYYFYNSCMMNGCTFRLTMEQASTLKFESSTPALNSVYNLTNGGQISFDFNKAVSFTGATINLAGQVLRLNGQVSNSSIFFNDVKSKVWSAMSSGQLKTGDSFTITLSGICLVSDKSVLYDGTGTLVATFLIGEMPIQLVNSENTWGDFLSYYTTANTRGIVKLHFSGKVNTERMAVQIKYGDIDKDASGDYYVEYLTPTLSEDGKTVIINLQGKRRKAVDMITSGTLYDNIALGVTGVMDENGNYAYAEGEASMGSYWYSYNFKEVTANVGCEFTPDNGSDISKKSTFEIWIMDEDKLTYDGIAVTYVVGGQTKSLLITDYEKEADTEPGFEGAAYLTYSLPAEVRTAKDITIGLHNLQCADGSDWSNTIRVRYNSFVISETKPLAGSSREFFDKGETITIRTNKDAEATHLNVVLCDANPGEGDQEVLFTGKAEKADKGFVYTVDAKWRLEKNHSYLLEATGIGVDGAAIGSDYIIYNGAADVFRYSDVLLSSVAPDPDTQALKEDADATVTLVYDGLVLLTESPLYTAVATDPDENGYSNTWTLTVSREAIAAAGKQITIPVYAVDSNETPYPVQGNTGYKDNNYLAIVYYIGEIDPDGISATPAGQAPVSGIYNLSGQRVPAARGIVITGGRKVYIK